MAKKTKEDQKEMATATTKSARKEIPNKTKEEPKRKRQKLQAEEDTDVPHAKSKAPKRRSHDEDESSAPPKRNRKDVSIAEEQEEEEEESKHETEPSKEEDDQEGEEGEEEDKEEDPDVNDTLNEEMFLKYHRAKRIDPPEHVKYNHIYSNAYRVGLAGGMQLQAAQARARFIGQFWKKHGWVPKGYVGTFRKGRSAK